VTGHEASLGSLRIGTSGWSYPGWRPGFYPAETNPKELLPAYAARLSTVELNTTGYRLPAEEQFRRWAVHLAPGEWRGKSFLDVGCGMGRNSFWPMHYGAREGCAVDIDERSLAQARRNLAGFATGMERTSTGVASSRCSRARGR